MSAARNDETIIFLHVPKAAGSTLGTVMQRQYPSEATYTMHETSFGRAFQEIRELPRARRDRLQLLLGHFPFGIHEPLSRPSRYVTILRDPLERAVSHYHHVLRRADHRLHEHVTSRRMSLHDYVESGISRELDNGQCALLGWSEDLRTHDDLFSPDLLLRAKRNLTNRFTVVGVAERFDETLLLLRNRLGWTRPLYYRLQNVTVDRPSVSVLPDETRRLIEEHNRLDFQLYRWARVRLEGEIAHAGAVFRWEVRSFRMRNAGYARIPSGILAGRRKVLAAVRGR